VPNSLFEPRELSFVHRELVDEHIEISSLIAEIHPKAHGIINNQKGKNEGEGENSGSGSFIISDRSQRGNHKSGMGARHMSMRKKVFKFKSVFFCENNKFQGLCEKPDNQGNDNHVVTLEIQHAIILQ